jgi:polysaccharide biosynthesis/export protein
VAPGTAAAQREVRIEGDTVVSSAYAPVERRRPESRGPLLDRPVSRSEYRLGPGDLVDVSIFGEIDRQFPLLVSPEGTLLIPTVGVANVLGLNLDEAEARVRRAAARFYRNVDVRLTLAEVRTFKVFVVGDVAVPGVRTATAATRVSEILDDAMAQEGRRTERRNVILRRPSGDTLLVDLARFFQMGDLTANPLLREGDVIVVPSIDRTVTVTGRVRYPATYQYRPGESLADLLRVANGGAGFPADVADSVRIARTDGTGARRFITVALADTDGVAGRALAMEPFDAVYVAARADFGRQPSARITGQVRHPGVYPIRPDTTTVRDLVDMAGGFTTNASLAQTTLRRDPAGWNRATQQMDSIPLELLGESERDVLRVRMQSDATVVSVGFHELFAQGSDAADLTLREDDEIVVPEHRNDVLVLGAVVQPGIVGHIPGAAPQAFIERAGGLTRRADLRNASVIRSRTGTRLDLRDVASLDAGDTLIVPFQRDVNWAQRIQLITGIAATLTGLALTAIALF